MENVFVCARTRLLECTSPSKSQSYSSSFHFCLLSLSLPRSAISVVMHRLSAPIVIENLLIWCFYYKSCCTRLNLSHLLVSYRYVCNVHEFHTEHNGFGPRQNKNNTDCGKTNFKFLL